MLRKQVFPSARKPQNSLLWSILKRVWGLLMASPSLNFNFPTVSPLSALREFKNVKMMAWRSWVVKNVPISSTPWKLEAWKLESRGVKKKSQANVNFNCQAVQRPKLLGFCTVAYLAFFLSMKKYFWLLYLAWNFFMPLSLFHSVAFLVTFLAMKKIIKSFNFFHAQESGKVMYFEMP